MAYVLCLFIFILFLLQKLLNFHQEFWEIYITVHNMFRTRLLDGHTSPWWTRFVFKRHDRRSIGKSMRCRRVQHAVLNTDYVSHDYAYRAKIHMWHIHHLYRHPNPFGRPMRGGHWVDLGHPIPTCQPRVNTPTCEIHPSLGVKSKIGWPSPDGRIAYPCS